MELRSRIFALLSIPAILLNPSCCIPPQAGPQWQTFSESERKAAVKAMDEAYAHWSSVLRAVVDDEGLVNWELFKGNVGGVKDELAAFVDALKALSPDTAPAAFLDRPEFVGGQPDVHHVPYRLAYWANAHNALAMQWVILHDYPSRIPEPLEGDWVIGGKPMTLWEVRQWAGAEANLCLLNGCRRSSPPLLKERYGGATLKTQFAVQLRRYLGDPRAVQVTVEEVKVNDLLLSYENYIIWNLYFQVRGPLDKWPAKKRDEVFLRTICALLGRHADEHWETRRLGHLGFDDRLNYPRANAVSGLGVVGGE